jgi:hypothetical protein
MYFINLYRCTSPDYNEYTLTFILASLKSSIQHSMHSVPKTPAPPTKASLFWIHNRGNTLLSLFNFRMKVVLVSAIEIVTPALHCSNPLVENFIASPNIYSYPSSPVKEVK